MASYKLKSFLDLEYHMNHFNIIHMHHPFCMKQDEWHLLDWYIPEPLDVCIPTEVGFQMSKDHAKQFVKLVGSKKMPVAICIDDKKWHSLSYKNKKHAGMVEFEYKIFVRFPTEKDAVLFKLKL